MQLDSAIEVMYNTPPEGRLELFITFEGIAGCGKSTQIPIFEAMLKDKGISPVITQEPGGTRIGEAIRKILLDVDNTQLTPLTELFLYEADRAQHVSEVIKPALEAGTWVICDRYYDATTVYQGVVLQGYEGLIEQLNLEACSHITPELTFLLDCPAEIGLSRIEERGRNHTEKDRFDRKTLDFHTRIRYGYLALAAKHRERFTIIDARLSREQVAIQIGEAISTYL
jgi:dTMP kinase